MTRRPPTNIAASVHDRLLDRARREGRPFNELLQYYGMERFLARLSRSPHADLFVLKGALMLPFWGGPRSRATRDIDLLALTIAPLDQVIQVFRECLAEEVEPDGLRFDPSSLRGEEIRLAADYRGVRATLRAYLGRALIRLQIDVGFGDAVTPRPGEIMYPRLLESGGFPLMATTPETAIAEKFHAIVVLEMANTRMKDFYDLWILASGREFRGEVVRQALAATFTRRGAELPAGSPIALTKEFFDSPSKQVQWSAFLRKIPGSGPSTGLMQATSLLAAFLMPVVASIRRGTTFAHLWRPGGPWEGE